METQGTSGSQIPLPLAQTVERVIQAVGKRKLPLPAVSLLQNKIPTVAIEWVQEGIFIDMTEGALELDIILDDPQLSFPHNHRSTEYTLPEGLDEALGDLLVYLPGSIMYAVQYSH